MNWEELTAIVVVALVAGFVVVLLLARDPPSRRIRFGVFVEREQLDDLEE